uniref:Caspase family p10 domain-containing protein n=1 Tax=Bos indicus x Bos taurus TaxID=30522 RepID=A0A4W2HCS0_BOBOX
MAFLVAGTLQVASQVADAQESLGRKGKYSVKDPRVALALCSPEVSASTAALLEGVFQTLGFESCRRQGASVQGFRGELTRFREQLDAHGGSVGCAFVALVARPWQLRQSQQLVRELSRCKALWGRPKVFLLLSSAPGGHRDAGVGPAALPWFRRWLRAPPATPSQADVLHVCTDVQGRSSRGPTPRSPNQADVLMVYAAAEGCVAYRDKKGSDFIQTLVEVLRADPKADLLELMTEVNRQVCELDVLGPDCDDRRKACLEIRSSLRRRLCLQV